MKLSEKLASRYDIGSNTPAARDGELRDSTLLLFLVGLWAKPVFVSFLSSVTAVIQFEDHLDRGGYGVYFKAQEQVEIVTSNWMHAFYLQLPRFAPENKTSHTHTYKDTPTLRGTTGIGTIIIITITIIVITNRRHHCY